MPHINNKQPKGGGSATQKREEAVRERAKQAHPAILDGGTVAVRSVEGSIKGEMAHAQL